MLVAGPASSSTSAAPGFRPFAISAAATGVLPVAHTYMGVATTSISSIATKPFGMTSPK
jgi:hypothetical protein